MVICLIDNTIQDINTPNTNTPNIFNDICINEGTKINEGLHGEIFHYKVGNNNIVAKRIKMTDKNHIDNEKNIALLEDVKNICKPIKIIETQDFTYFFQECAKSDLKIWRDNTIYNPKLFLNIIEQMIIAVEELHKHSILHGDIKLNNFLIFDNHSIKLTDFSETKVITDKNKGNICSYIYRPLEVWKKENWNISVDIWSFGCTIYEFVYNNNLFNLQKETKFQDKKYINAILDYSNVYKNDKNILYKSNNMNYERPNYRLDFGSKTIDKFILFILEVYSERRPNIAEVKEKLYKL